jgi:hypothetical protein
MRFRIRARPDQLLASAAAVTAALTRARLTHLAILFILLPPLILPGPATPRRATPRTVQEQLRASGPAAPSGGSGASAEPPAAPAAPLNESSVVVDSLCRALEMCLFHGVKKSREPGELPHFWPVVEGLPKVNEAAFGPTLFMVRQLPTVQTPYGLCRAWIRKILNENSLVRRLVFCVRLSFAGVGCLPRAFASNNTGLLFSRTTCVW